MTPQKICMPLPATILAILTVGVTGAMVYRMWRQAIAPAHITTPAAQRALTSRRPS